MKRTKRTSNIHVKTILIIQKQKVAEEKGALRICQNEEEHQRQWGEAEKAKEEVTWKEILTPPFSKISFPGEEENPEKV